MAPHPRRTSLGHTPTEHLSWTVTEAHLLVGDPTHKTYVPQHTRNAQPVLHTAGR